MFQNINICMTCLETIVNFVKMMPNYHYQNSNIN